KKPGAILAHVPSFIGSTPFFHGSFSFAFGHVCCPVFGCIYKVSILTGYFCCFIAKYALGTTVPVFNITIYISSNNHIIGGTFHSYTQAFFAFTHCFFCQPAVGN